MWSKIRDYLFPLGLFFLITIVVTWPLVLNMNRFIVDRFDGLLITWIINWGIHAPFSYNTNIFFPYQNTLAFSDLLIPQALIAAPFVRIFKEPLLAYNINFLVAFFLTAWSIFLLAKFLTKNIWLALFLGLLFSFAPLRFSYLAHIQLLNFWPVVLAVLFLLQKRDKLFLLFFVIASLTTVLFFYFLLLTGIIRKKFLVLVIGCLLVAPFLLPYYQVSWQFHYVRPITDAIHNSLQFPDLFSLRPNGPKLFFGWTFVILFVGLVTKIGLVWKDKNGRFFLVLTGVSLVLALGPALHIYQNTVHLGVVPAIPLPYALFYYLVPGFSGLRTPSRWIILTAFALTMAIVIYLTKRAKSWVLVVLSILIFLEIPKPIKFYQVPKVTEFPEEQRWLKNNRIGEPIIQFPIYGWFDMDKVGVETMRQYYSTIHWHPMYNGYSGFSPAEWEGSVKWLQKEFPSEATIRFLAEKGIKLVLDSRKIPELKIVKAFGNVTVYEID